MDIPYLYSIYNKGDKNPEKVFWQVPEHYGRNTGQYLTTLGFPTGKFPDEEGEAKRYAFAIQMEMEAFYGKKLAFFETRHGGCVDFNRHQQVFLFFEEIKDA